MTHITLFHTGLIMLLLTFAQACSPGPDSASPKRSAAPSTPAAAAASAQPASSARPPAAIARPKPVGDPNAKPGSRETAVFAGGCFWCVEAVFEQLDGVIEATSGYAGGTKETANYEAVCTGKTGHAEVVQITYDPSKIRIEKLLEIHFATHDPTSLNRQGLDQGTQYRSAIFYSNDQQKQIAQAYIEDLTAAKAFISPIVTTLEPLKEFFPAETYHQNYVCLNPNQGYIRNIAMPKVTKVREHFSDLVKPDAKP